MLIRFNYSTKIIFSTVFFIQGFPVEDYGFKDGVPYIDTPPYFYILLFRWASFARPTSRPRGLPIPLAFRGAGGMGDNPPLLYK